MKLNAICSSITRVLSIYSLKLNMRQGVMVETSKIMIVQYNVVADALSKKSSSLVASL